MPSTLDHHYHLGSYLPAFWKLYALTAAELVYSSFPLCPLGNESYDTFEPE